MRAQEHRKETRNLKGPKIPERLVAFKTCEFRCVFALIGIELESY